MINHSLKVLLGGRFDDANITVGKFSVKISTCTKIQQADFSTLRIVEEIRPVGICLHEIKLEKLLKTQTKNVKRHKIPHILIKINQFINRDPRNHLRSQNPPRGERINHLGHIKDRIIAQKLNEFFLTLCLAKIVCFPLELSFRILHRLFNKNALWKRVCESQQRQQILNIAINTLRNSRILNLHSNLRPVQKRGLMHLPNGSSRNWTLLKRGHFCAPILAQLGAQNAQHLRGRHKIGPLANPLENINHLSWKKSFILNTQHLTKLQRCSPHPTQSPHQSLRIRFRQKNTPRSPTSPLLQPHTPPHHIAHSAHTKPQP
eukprot:Sdes_comp9906_c0_seq1m1448